MESNAKIFREGFRDGIPIGLGYFAVAFSLGIAAHGYGFGPVHGFIASILTYASAGQYIGFSLYAANATLAQLIILTVITNARYILMGVTLNQRMPAGTSLGRRVAVGTTITDEIFGITISSGLSASFESAEMARRQFIEAHPGAKVHIFDSKATGPDRATTKKTALPVAYSGDDWVREMSKTATLTITSPDGTETIVERTGTGAEPFKFGKLGEWTVQLAMADGTTRTAIVTINQDAGFVLTFR